MQQTDWETMDEVPLPFTMLLPPVNIPEDGAECHLGTVSQWQSIVAVEVGWQISRRKYQILFTPTGEIIRARNVTYTYNPLGAATFL